MAKRKGFYYSVEKEILKDYATWPGELKLKWLMVDADLERIKPR